MVEVSMRSGTTGDTHKTMPICIWVFPDVFRQDSTRHPFRNKLKRNGSDTEEGDNILVFQAFPHYSLLVEGLWDPSWTTLRGNDRTTNLCRVSPTVLL